MDKKIIIANWKMNPQTAEEALRLVQGILTHRLPKNVELIIAPPFVYLDLVKNHCGKEIKLAGQNVNWAERGAYTGEVSCLMLKNMGCNYVIIGHSERRHKMGETEEMINLKIKAAFKTGLIPILAIGEQEQNDDIIKTLTRQMTSALEGVDVSKISRLIVAYEPVWAIGTGLVDTPDHALSAALLIRKIVGNLYEGEWATDLPVLYGGSVSDENAADFVSQRGISGALVGSAALELQKFIKIIKAAEINE